MQDESLAQAIRIMSDHRISALPVVNRTGHLQGILTEGDFFSNKDPLGRLSRFFGTDPGSCRSKFTSRTVEDIMSPDPIAIDVDASIETAVELMEHRALKRLPVTEKGRVVGLISRADILRALVE